MKNDAKQKPKKERKAEEGSKNIAPDFDMVKNSLKNFGKNLVYSFVPMGTVYLFMLLAIAIFVSSALQNLSVTLNKIVETVGASMEQSSASVDDFLAYAFGRIDWNGNFFGILKKIVDMNWVSETVKGFFETLSASTEGFDAQINGIVSAFFDKMSVDIGVAVSLVAVGVWVANSVTRYVLRRRTAKRGIRNFLIAHTLVPFVQSIVVFVAGILFAFIKWFAILALFGAVALWAVVSLMNSYLIYCGKDVPITLKDVITRRNVISHLLVALIVLAIDIVLFVALWFIKPILSVLIIVPFLIYSINIVDLGSDSYVLGLVNILKGTNTASEGANAA